MSCTTDKSNWEVMEKNIVSEIPSVGFPLTRNPSSDIFVFYDIQKMVFHVTDTDLVIHKTINFPYESIDTTESVFFSKWYIQSSDSLYFINSEKELIRFNSDLVIQEKLALPSGLYHPLNVFHAITIQDSHLYFSRMDTLLRRGKKAHRLYYYQHVRPAYAYPLNPTSSDSGQQFGTFPSSYKTTGNNYYQYTPYITSGQGDLIITSYSCDDHLYIFKNSKLIRTVECKSEHIDAFKYIPDNKLRNLRFVADYQVESAKYLEVVYDPFQNLYYRKVKLPMDRNQPDQAQWSIITLNDQFETIDEIVFTERDYSQWITLPTPQGLLVKNGKNSPANTSIYSIIKFTP